MTKIPKDPHSYSYSLTPVRVKRKPGARIEGGRLLYFRCPLIRVDYLLAARLRGACRLPSKMTNEPKNSK